MARPVRRSVGSNLSSPTLSNIKQNHYLHESIAHSHLASNNSEKADSKRIYANPHGISNIQNSNTSTPTTSNPQSIIQSNYDIRTASQSPNFTEFNETLTARERERMEFYATYDVMTGVRIAATLGGFFGLMVFLVIYKSRSHSSHPLKAMKKNPQLAAQAAIVMQAEEQRELEAAWHATSRFFLPEADSLPSLGFKRERMLSLGNISAPPALHRGFRFSSYGGGYSSLLEPPRRFSYSGIRRKSASESSRVLSACQLGESFEIDEYLCTSDVEEADDEFDQGTTTAEIGYHSFLNVPGKDMSSRRCSDITCSSADSYLERRCSAITLGLTSLPPISSVVHSRRTSREISDYFPNIQVIQPTPKTSPCPSEGNIFDRTRRSSRSKSYEPSESFDYISEYPDEYHEEIYSRHKSKIEESTINTTTEIPLRRAPLASLSSFKISSADYQDSDLRSLGSDSVFAESYADTDDDMEQFSTDSDELSNNDPQSPRTSNRSNNQSNYSSGSKTTQIEKYSTDQPVLVASGSGGATSILVEDDSENVGTKTEVINIVTKFETQAIIERHDNKLLLDDGATSAVQDRHRIAVVADANDASQSNNCSPMKTESSEIKKPNNVTSDSKSSTNKIGSSSSSHNTNCSKQKLKTNNKSKTSECEYIDVRNVDSNNRQQQQHATSPSVILELPVLSVSNNQLNVDVRSSSSPTPSSSTIHSQQHTLNPYHHPDDDSTIDIDPSIPGQARKWSKETLF